MRLVAHSTPQMSLSQALIASIIVEVELLRARFLVGMLHNTNVMFPCLLDDMLSSSTCYLNGFAWHRQIVCMSAWLKRGVVW